MPAGTSSSVGSSAIRLAEGTTVCPFFSKNRRYRRATSADSMLPVLALVDLIDGRVARRVLDGSGPQNLVRLSPGIDRWRLVEGDGLAELGLTFGHARAYLFS